MSILYENQGKAWIERGRVFKDFRVRGVVITGLPWISAKRYIVALRYLRYTTKQGRRYTVTREGQHTMPHS